MARTVGSLNSGVQRRARNGRVLEEEFVRRDPQKSMRLALDQTDTPLVYIVGSRNDKVTAEMILMSLRRHHVRVLVALTALDASMILRGTQFVVVADDACTKDVRQVVADHQFGLTPTES